jgi:hypothetical protein
MSFSTAFLVVCPAFREIQFAVQQDMILPRFRGVLEDEYCARFSSSVFKLLIRPGFCSLSPQKRVKIISRWNRFLDTVNARDKSDNGRCAQHTRSE